MIDRRFLTLAEVAEILNISSAQTYALVRGRSLRAIKIGGRGQYRVEAAELEDFIARMYTETDDFLKTHPFGLGDAGVGDAEVEAASGARDAAGTESRTATP